MSSATTFTKWLAPLALVAAAGGAMAQEEAAAEREAFKVCADPFSLPQSSRQKAGYENKIAELFAERLGLPLEYYWFPQRIGFIRNTLRNDDTPDGSYRCDIVMGVVEGFDIADTTIPYYRSVWTMAYEKGGKLDSVQTLDDMLELPEEAQSSLTIGLFDRSPAAHWVLENGFMDNMRPYQSMAGDARVYPGKIIEDDLLAGEIDAAFVWGPVAGYFAKRAEERGREVVVVPMPLDTEHKYDYQITMAVRYGEPEWKAQINQLIRDNREEIQAILDEYNVPTLPLKASAGGDEDEV